MVRFGIIGTGRISDWVLKGALQDPRFKAVAVCSRTSENAQKFIKNHPEAFDSEAKCLTSVEEMTLCKDIDAIYIGTPNKTHLAYTLTALRAGKHVLCEKPMACNEGEIKQMIQAARESGKVLMEAMISTLNPNFLKAKEMISDIAPVRHFKTSFCQYSSKYEALKEGIVANSFNPQMGGGALPDVGIYVTYPLIVLFGKPDSVKGDIITLPSEFGDIDVHGNISAKYSGMTADLTYSKIVDSLTPTEICGEKGNIIIDQMHICREVRFASHAAPTSGRGKGAEARIVSSGLPMDEYYYEFKEFIDIIESGHLESKINSLENSLLNRQLMDSVQV